MVVGCEPVPFVEGSVVVGVVVVVSVGRGEANPPEVRSRRAVDDSLVASWSTAMISDSYLRLSKR